jgi:hypothetical protein
MTPERIAAYGLALVLIMALLVRLLARPKAVVRARDITGILVAGDNPGSITQTRTETAPPSGSEGPPSNGDRVAWAIGIIGVLIAAAQFAFDVLK